MNEHPKRLLSVKEAAYYIDLSPRTLYNRIAPASKDPFPVVLIRQGKKISFDIRDLDEYIENLKNSDGAVRSGDGAGPGQPLPSVKKPTRRGDGQDRSLA